MNKHSGMKMGELEKRSGIPRSTIHHYVQYGLLHRPTKTGQTQARYDESHLKRLKTIQEIKVEYLKTTGTTRIPMDYIMHKISKGYTLQKQYRLTAKDKKPKRSKEKIQKRKEEIIEAALKLYHKKGYYLTNIREITAELGVTAPTFYNYFQDKREFFVEVIEHVIKKYKGEMREALASEPDPAKRSLHVFRIFYRNYPIIGEILNQLRAATVIGDPWAKERLSKLYSAMAEETTKRIQDFIDQGLVRNVNPELHALYTILLNEATIQLSQVMKKYDIHTTLSFLGDIHYHAFLTDKGKEILQSFRGSSESK